MKDMIGTSFSAPEKAVYGALSAYGNADSGQWPKGAERCEGFAAWPSVPTLMKATGLSDRGVQISLGNLQAGGAICCILKSSGGGSEKGDRKKRNSTCCYLLTPNGIHPDKYGERQRKRRTPGIVTPNGIHPEQSTDPRTVFTAPPNQVHPTPERYSPSTSEYGSPKDLDHHHQGEVPSGRSNTTSAKNPVPLNPDDDDGARKRAPMPNGEAEFAERLKEHRWAEGPIADVYAIVVLVGDALRYEERAWREFLGYDATMTSPGKIKNPAAYCRTLVVKFLGSRPQRHLAQQKRLEQQRLPAAEATQSVCELGNPNCQNGELFEEGRLTGSCECQAGQRIAELTKQVLKLNRVTGTLGRG